MNPDFTPPPWAGRYTDKLTGFTGEATARNELWHGPVQICLVKLDNYGKPQEEWFSRERLEREPKGDGHVGF